MEKTEKHNHLSSFWGVNKHYVRNIKCITLNIEVGSIEVHRSRLSKETISVVRT